MLENIFNQIEALEISSSQIKIFVLTFIAVSLMVGLQHLGVHSPFAILSLYK